MPVSSWTERVRRDEIIDIASKLIAIPSTSGDELAIMEFVLGWCAARGLETTVVAKDPNRPNVIVSIGDGSTGPTIAMNGHLDVVPVSDPDSWRTGPYDPVISEDGTKLFGRGSSDMKSIANCPSPSAWFVSAPRTVLELPPIDRLRCSHRRA